MYSYTLILSENFLLVNTCSQILMTRFAYLRFVPLSKKGYGPLFVQISQQNPTNKPTYLRKNLPENARKNIYIAPNGQ